MSITGLGPEEAQFFLDMSGNDLDVAVQLFFSGGNAADATESTAAATSYETPANESSNAKSSNSGWDGSLKSLVFPQGHEIHEAWLVQGLQLTGQSEGFTASGDWDQLGIFQPKNGPCGVLAAFLASVVSVLLDGDRLVPGAQAGDDDIVEATVRILSRCKADDRPFNICMWAGGVDGELITESATTAAEARAVLAAQLQLFKAAGGAMLLVYSAVATYGADRFHHIPDLIPLVSNFESLPFQLCTSALMSLLLSGCPRENLSAYDTLSGQPVEWDGTPNDIGFLSGSEKELRIRIHDAFKFPRKEVYVLHGRDHFTTAYAVPSSWSSFEFTLVHWNGLPPAGPRAAVMKVSAPLGPCGKAPATAAQGVGRHYKPVVGSIDSIVQANKNDKLEYPYAWQKWRYEIALAVDDPTDVSEPWPADKPLPKVFHLDPTEVTSPAPWRCRTCYQVKFVLFF